MDSVTDNIIYVTYYIRKYREGTRWIIPNDDNAILVPTDADQIVCDGMLVKFTRVYTRASIPKQMVMNINQRLSDYIDSS